LQPCPHSEYIPFPLPAALPISLQGVPHRVLHLPRGQRRRRADADRGPAALPRLPARGAVLLDGGPRPPDLAADGRAAARHLLPRSEEHTSELQSRENLVCRLLL